MSTETGVTALLVLCLELREDIGVELWRRAVLGMVLTLLLHVCTFVIGVDVDGGDAVAACLAKI